MKYLILIQNNPAVVDLFAQMSDAQRAAAFQVYWQIETDLQRTGELVDSKALDTASQKVVSHGAGGPVVTDAPLPELTESVSGYYLVEVSDEARAVEIGAGFPEAAVGGIRVARVWTTDDFAAMGASPTT